MPRPPEWHRLEHASCLRSFRNYGALHDSILRDRNLAHRRIVSSRPLLAPKDLLCVRLGCADITNYCQEAYSRIEAIDIRAVPWSGLLNLSPHNASYRKRIILKPSRFWSNWPESYNSFGGWFKLRRSREDCRQCQYCCYVTRLRYCTFPNLLKHEERGPSKDYDLGFRRTYFHHVHLHIPFAHLNKLLRNAQYPSINFPEH